jgi:hypothetical protein
LVDLWVGRLVSRRMAARWVLLKVGHLGHLQGGHLGQPLEVRWVLRLEVRLGQMKVGRPVLRLEVHWGRAACARHQGWGYQSAVVVESV